MNTQNEIETLTALLICAASKLGEADDLVLPAWAMNEYGDPDFTAITAAGRQLLQSRNGVADGSRDLETDTANDTGMVASHVGEMIDKAYSACKLTAVVMAFGIHCGTFRCGIVEATHNALHDCEIE